MRSINRLLSERLARPAQSSFFVCASCRTAAARRFSSATSLWSPAPSAPPPTTGLVALSSRRLISISGPDAPKFLQGVITQNILAPQSAAAAAAATTIAGAAAGPKIRDDGFYSAFLTATGRVLYDVFIYPDHRQSSSDGGDVSLNPNPAVVGESFLIEVDAAEATRLERHIKRYKLRAKFSVRLLDPGEVTVWHGWDDDGRAALDASTAGVEDFHRFVHMRDPRAPGLGWRMLRTGDSEPLVDLPRVADEEVYRVRRYLHGVAEGQSELLREGALPLEGNLDVMGGIDFRKGCYVGQELTIRTKHRGVVRKRVLPVMIYDGPEPPQQMAYDASSSLDAAAVPVDTSIGRLGKKGRSAGKWLSGTGNVGLALCRLEIMTDVVLPGETAATTFNPADEFVMERSEVEDGQEPFKVKIKAFVPEWLRQGLEQHNSGHT